MGATLGSGTFEVPRTEAGACTECRVGYKAPRPESGVDYWLDIVYRPIRWYILFQSAG